MYKKLFSTNDVDEHKSMGKDMQCLYKSKESVNISMDFKTTSRQ